MDFSLARLTAADQERIAQNLKNVPQSPRDRHRGKICIREVIEGWDVAFVTALDDAEWVVLVIGFERAGEMESQLDLCFDQEWTAYPTACNPFFRADNGGRRHEPR